MDSQLGRQFRLAFLFSAIALFLSGCGRGFSVSEVASSTSPVPTPASALPDPVPLESTDAAQLPNLLAKYPVRPSWQVAGVDYAVGVPSGVVLKAPAAISLAGVSVNATSRTVSVSGDNVSIDGYDFTGWQVYVYGKGVTIKNSNFKVGSNYLIPVVQDGSSNNLTVEHCTFDGSGPTGVDTLINSKTGDPNAVAFTAKYNWFKDAAADVIWVLNGQATVENNLYTSGSGKHASGAHVDFVQFCRSYSTGSKIVGNTLVFESLFAGEVAGEGIQIEAQLGSTLTNTEVAKNTLVSYRAASGNSAGVSASFLFAVRQSGSGNVVNGISIHDNYVDATGAYGVFYNNRIDGSNASAAGNINLLNGKTVNPDNSES